MPKLSDVKLTDRMLKALKWPPVDAKPGQRDALYFDSETRGFGVRLTKAGTRTFLVRYTDRITKAKRQVALGEYGAVTVEEARGHARAILGEAVAGDPVGRRKAEQAAAEAFRRAETLTIEALIIAWDERHLAHRREKYRREMVACMRGAFPSLLTRSAVTLTKADVMRAVELARAGGHLEKQDGRSAGRGRDALVARAVAGCRAMFNWGHKAGLVIANPFEGLPLAPSKVERDRWLNSEELGAVYAAAGAMPYPFGPFVQLLVLTGQRLREVAGMRWSEVDAARATWTMPADRQKNSKPHLVHLSEPALAVLRDLAAIRSASDFVFTTTGRGPISGFSFAKADLDARSGVAAWTFHDLRRTLASGMADLGVSVEVAGKILAHKAGIMRGVDRVYQRSEFLPQRRDALEAWGAHVAACATAVMGSLDSVNAAPGRTALLARRRVSGTPPQPPAAEMR